MPQLVSMIEDEVKSRLQQLDLEDVAYILKVLS